MSKRSSEEDTNPTDTSGLLVAPSSPPNPTTPPSKKVNRRSPASTPIPLLNEDELDPAVPVTQEDYDSTARVLDQMPIEEQIQFSGLIGLNPRPSNIGLSKYRLLGNSGLRVSPLCLGTMGFGNNWSAMIGKMNKAQAEQIFEQYVQRGGNFIDLALKYQDGESVEWVAEWLAKRPGLRDQLVLGAKYSISLKYGDINSAGNHRKSMFRVVDETLRQLHTTYIDILNVHVWDFTTPVEELMRALDDLVRMGKVHYVGISDSPAWQVARANVMASMKGWTPFISYQGKYHPRERGVEVEILPMCREMGLGFIPWGLHEWCRRYPKEKDAPGTTEIDKTIMAIAAESGKTPTQVVLNWVHQTRGVVSPIINCHTVAELDEAIHSLEFKLKDEQVARMDKATAFPATYPYNYIGDSYQSSPWFKDAGSIVKLEDLLP